MARTQLWIPSNTELPLGIPDVKTAGDFVVSVPAGQEEAFAELLQIEAEVVDLVETSIQDENHTIRTVNGEQVATEDSDESEPVPAAEQAAQPFLQAMGFAVPHVEPLPQRVQMASHIVTQFLHYRYHHGAGVSDNQRSDAVEAAAVETMLYAAAAQTLADWLRGGDACGTKSLSSS